MTDDEKDMQEPLKPVYKAGSSTLVLDDGDTVTITNPVIQFITFGDESDIITTQFVTFNSGMTFEKLKALVDSYTIQHGIRLDGVRMNAEEYVELFNYARPKLYHPFNGIWVDIPEADREVRPAHPDWEYFWIGGNMHIKVVPDPQVPRGEIRV